jgi:DNA-directed RNA polymerase subunit omega
MLEELRDTALVKKAGGRFKLTALIQKRLTELIQGSRPLIRDTQGMTNLEIVIREIKEEKISFEYENQAEPATK